MTLGQIKKILIAPRAEKWTNYEYSLFKKSLKFLNSLPDDCEENLDDLEVPNT